MRMNWQSVWCKQFDMGIYTNRNHGIYGGNTSLQLYTKFVKYLNEHLK